MGHENGTACEISSVGVDYGAVEGNDYPVSALEKTPSSLIIGYQNGNIVKCVRKDNAYIKVEEVD